MLLERDIERRLKQRVEQERGICYKFLSTVSGVPDRLVILPRGVIVFVEVKAPKKRPRPLQRRVMNKLKEKGCNVLVVDSYESVEEVFKFGLYSTRLSKNCNQ